MRPFREWAKSSQSFRQRHARSILLSVYLVIGVFATWQWQEAVDEDLNCRFDKLDNTLFAIKVEILNDQLRNQQMLLALHSTPDVDRQKYIDDITRINEKSIKYSERVLDGSIKTQNRVNDSCKDLSYFGWSFFGLSLLIAVLVGIMTSPFAPDVSSRRRKGKT